MNWYDSLVSWAEEHGIMAGSLIACIITTIKCYKTKGLLTEEEIAQITAKGFTIS